ncbi:uncharacterized protein LOC132203331 [Neocloeon triangulifer]|uniref:uncharacterized protein LOC132203331 n=1 Tax=Neocloeon triangulifer TaxID=2078957 RepID=UPI00286EC0E6|nr:uncharacterized protein LOC132203331 [Neocloeon triangulifer]
MGTYYPSKKIHRRTWSLAWLLVFNHQLFVGVKLHPTEQTIETVELAFNTPNELAMLQQIVDEIKDLHTTVYNLRCNKEQKLIGESRAGIKSQQTSSASLEALSKYSKKQEELEKQLVEVTNFFKKDEQFSVEFNLVRQEINQTNVRLEKLQTKIIETLQQEGATHLVERLFENENHTNNTLSLARITQELRQKGKNDKTNFPCGCEAYLRRAGNDKKYYFSHPKFAPTIWAVANETCARLGLHLATHRNNADLWALWDESKKVLGSAHWWLSAKDLGSAGKPDIHWHDGTKLEVTSPFWYPGASKANCGFSVSATTEKLYGEPCTNNKHFICELPAHCY